MGIVYRVKRRSLDRAEALKVIAPRYAADPSYRARFKREATHAALAHHPHVVTVYDANESEGRLYIAMQFVDGEDLRKRIAAGPLLPPSAAEITRQVGSALDAAHAAGLVHRDVKPANILLAAHGAGDHAYLTDFGVSRRISSDDDLTQPGMFVGAADYAAPEQHRGEPVDARTDVYSLACVLFEMLTGQKPFVRDSSTAVAMAHCADPPPTPTSLNPRLGEAFDSVLLKAMAKQPDDRYQTALELGEAAMAAAAGADWDEIKESVDNVAPDDAGTDETQILPRRKREPSASEEATRILPGAPRPPSPKPAGPAAPPRRAARDARPRRRGRRSGLLAAVAALVIVVAALGIYLATRTSGGKSATVAADTNIRSSPDVPAANPQSNVVGSFNSAQRVKVSCWTAGSGSPDGWARLQSPDSGRYVSATLLTPVIRTPAC